MNRPAENEAAENRPAENKPAENKAADAPTRIGINGFGRIGRLVVRALRQHPQLQLVHINELKGTSETAAHLLEFDSVHGRYAGTVSHTSDGDKTGAGEAAAVEVGILKAGTVQADALRIDGHPVSFSNFATPGEVPWDDIGVEIVLECSGAFRTVDSLQPYFERGVAKVLVAAPVPDSLNIVIGCNDDLYDPSRDHIVTAASCTTNALAPVVKVLQEQIGIERGVITTIHDVTNTQVVVDAPHKDLRRARSALNSLIPTSTGSATAITMIYPELAGKLNGLAVRVPLLNASLVDAVFTLSRDVTAQELNNMFQEAAEGELQGILGFESRPLVSADYTNDTRSGIVDGPSTMVVDGCLAKILIWYDNEYGYAFRLADLAVKVAGSLGSSSDSSNIAQPKRSR